MSKMSSFFNELVEEEMDFARKLVEEGWLQTSRRYCRVGRIPEGMTGEEVLLEQGYDPERIAKLDFWHIANSAVGYSDRYFGCTKTLSRTQFKAFRKCGGDIWPVGTHEAILDKIKEEKDQKGSN